MEKKKIPSFTPESEIEEDDSGAAFRGDQGEAGDGTPDFFTWLEKHSPDSEAPASAEGEFGPAKTDLERIRTGISER